MADLVLERWTTCATGRAGDVRVCEVVLQDDDRRDAKDATPRTTRAVRIVLRGDASVLKRQVREVVVTQGRGAARTILAAVRFSAQSTTAVTLPAGLTIQWPLTRGWSQGWDYRIGPAVDAPLPAVNDRLDTHLAKGVR